MITIDYSSLPGLTGSTKMPIIPVTFINSTYEFPTFALVDSGATSNVISTVVAEALNINWEKIPFTIGFSVGSNIRCHNAKLIAEVYDNKYHLSVDIIEGLSPYKCILGQSGIFRWTKIIFEGYNKQFKIDFRELN